jgi:DNA modification methylase
MSNHHSTQSSSPGANRRGPRPGGERPLPYSDLDVSKWRDYEGIETGSLWLFDSRDRRNGHELNYHGNCVPQILTQLLTRFTRTGDVVLDCFHGSGTTSIEATYLGRKAVGVELKPDLVQAVQERIDALGRSSDVRLLNGSSADGDWLDPAARQAFQELGVEQAQFLFLHPPYDDIIRFSDRTDDLSNQPSTEKFLDLFEQVAQNGYRLLAPGRFAALVIGDKYSQGELIPLGFQCMERMNRVGFVTKSIIVKNIAGNEKGKGRTSNLWRYRALAGGFYLFQHEYVILFYKPARSSRRSPRRVRSL